MEQTARLFLGLHLYPHFKNEIDEAVERLRSLHPDQKWVNPEFIHFTVHFLGETSPEQKQKVMEFASQAAAATEPFKVALKDMGAFPSLKTPRVVWIGAAESCQEDLARLYKRITEPLIREGFPVEHEQFTPHATLFRVKRENPIEWNPAIFQFSQTTAKTIDRLFLFKSVQTSTAAEYHPCEEFIFGSGYTSDRGGL